MSYTESLPVQPVRSRPGVVTAAVWLIYLVALLMMVSAAMALMVAGAMRDAYEQAFAELAERESAVIVSVAIAVGSAIVMLLLAVGLVILGYLDGKGRNGARITTWVLAGLSVCCLGYGAISEIGGALGNAGTSGDTIDGEDVRIAMEEHLPAWYTPAATAMDLVALVVSLLVIVLLAMPAANAFFRKPQPTGQP